MSGINKSLASTQGMPVQPSGGRPLPASQGTDTAPPPVSHLTTASTPAKTTPQPSKPPQVPKTTVASVAPRSSRENSPSRSEASTRIQGGTTRGTHERPGTSMPDPMQIMIEGMDILR
ncbi:hypothetical protein RND81_03G020700 [Saponaria officinalis]|uniref:Uncharacterized protein n=1 Tax=Saponaria officinalis TaxID=3572 RepID=A0AAW1M1Z8_SAPOF